MLLRQAGFRPIEPRPLPAGSFGPPRPLAWRWRPPRKGAVPAMPPSGRRSGAFAALAELVG
jgi:ATP-dependent RNA helicase SUPV3L1/SUV3